MSFHPSKRAGERGSAFIEFVLLFPMLFFLFIGAFDMGFLCYAFIGTQNAARVAALYTSSTATASADSAGACLYALTELTKMPNSSQFLSGCSSAPLQVTAVSSTGPDGKPASTVTVSYQTIRLPVVPIPGFTPQFTIRRSVQMRVRT
ncbi:MAG: TadE/TadG family type IV pilus assembly protein [Bryobacteraceae bacterium]|jgi:Flp pilus assembly protein TadG